MAESMRKVTIECPSEPRLGRYLGEPHRVQHHRLGRYLVDQRGVIYGGRHQRDMTTWTGVEPEPRTWFREEVTGGHLLVSDDGVAWSVEPVHRYHWRCRCGATPGIRGDVLAQRLAASDGVVRLS